MINDKLFNDWISEGWIDDVFTISGNKMSGDDGNGPIKLTKAEKTPHLRRMLLC